MTEVTQSFEVKDISVNQILKGNQIGQEHRNPLLKRINGHPNSVSNSSAGGRDMNFCEVYYLSSSKRQSKENFQSSLNYQARDNWKITQKKRSKMKQRIDENSYGVAVSERTCDQSLDNFEIRSHYSDSAATAPMQLGRARSANVTFSNCAEERIHSNRGSLKRSKGRSNQSLCSCDADTDIIPDPNRPLYQYTLDRKNKAHTYTCEQNAQILLRLEREKRKATATGDKQLLDMNRTFNESVDDTTFEAPTNYQDTNNSCESDSTIDVDTIPPPPPPISMSWKTVSYQQEPPRGSANSTRPTESMLNDCTSTILNCANVGNVSNVEPDLCHVNQTVSSVQTDPEKVRINQENISITPYPYIRDDSYVPCFKSKTEESVFFYHQEAPQYAPNFDNRPKSSKFNTIGPSSCYAKQFSQQESNRSNLAHFNSSSLSNGRYFSQSLSNFSLSGQQGRPDGFRWNCHPHDPSNTPYTQFRSQANGLSCSFGESTMIDSSFTSIGSTASGVKSKLHQQQQQSSNASMPWKHRQSPSRGSSSSGSNSLRFDPSRHWLAVSSILLIVGAASVAVPLALRVAASAPFEERLRVATQLLDEVPLIDGHNDLPWNIRKFLHNKLNDFNFDEDLREVMPWARSHWSHTDLQRLKKGRVSAQFWAAYVPCEAQHRDAVQLTLEQIDVINRLTERYSPQLTTCTSVSAKQGLVLYHPTCHGIHSKDHFFCMLPTIITKNLVEDIIEAHRNHQLCSLTGVEGGHSLGGSLAVLRTLYAIGVRYMTLTSTCHTPWADSSYADAPSYNMKHGGLTIFGRTIIREMNRLGMIVDLSHVSTGTMRDALATTEAPAIFSHSSAYELCNSSRNVQDDILQAVAKNRGLVMVNFYSKFLSCSENSTVQDAVAHINHIKKVAGIDHVGLGAGFDGINFTPKGLEDVSTYPTLFAELLGAGWSIEDLTKLAGQNFLRVMSEVEKVRDEKKLAGVRPYEDHPNFRTEDPYNCTSS